MSLFLALATISNHFLLFHVQTLTLSALQSLQGSQPGQTILVKADNGQYQLLRIGPPAGAQQVAPGTLTTSSGNQTIRLQTVPAVSRFAGPPLALRKTITVSQAQTSTAVAQQQVKLTSKQSQNVMNSHYFCICLQNMISILII